MTVDEIAARVRRAIAAALGVDPARVEDRSRLVLDLGADGLGRVEVFLALEAEFGVCLMRTVSHATRLVASALAERERLESVQPEDRL